MYFIFYRASRDDFSLSSSFLACVCAVKEKKVGARLAEGDGGGLWCNEVKKKGWYGGCVCVGGVGVIEGKSESVEGALLFSE